VHEGRLTLAVARAATGLPQNIRPQLTEFVDADGEWMRVSIMAGHRHSSPENDLDPDMVAIAGAIIRQWTGKFEYPLFEVYLSANHRGARILRRGFHSASSRRGMVL
jgi:hypothetical protein